ncbi:hypothetical protein D7X33_36320 [Butyricicoccus sp. 1XD8-22]|nr:hypothetical protein D7X33_36320 [Butyricicoccus sp. 1XD8-22]
MKKPFYKTWWFIAIIVIFVLAGIGNAINGDEKKEEVTEQEEVEASNNASEENETEQIPAASTVEETEEVEETPSADEVNFYKNELSPQLDSIQEEYDRIWSEQWTTTFNGVSDGTMDVYTAYKNMTFIQTNYSVLSDNIANLNGDGLSEENKESLEGFKEKLAKSSDYRAYAASEAAKMFDEGTFKPSEIDNITSIVSLGDSEMMEAIINRLSIEQNLGLIEETE